MGHPTGNEYIHRGHPWARALGWAGAFVGFVLVVWLNLWSVTVALWRVHGLATIFWLLQFGKFGYVLTHVVNRHMFHVGISLDFSKPAPVDQDHLAWLVWKQFALQHMLGSGIHWGRTAPLAWVLAANLGFFLACWGPALWRAHQLYRAPDPSRRPGTSGWTDRSKLGLYVDAVRRPGSLPLGTVVGGLPGEKAQLALPAQQRFEHIEVLGVTGSGKTGCVFKPWVLRDGLLNDVTLPNGAYSTVAIDIKHPDLYDAVAPYLAAHPDRRLLVIAPDHADTTMSYNPLDALDRTDPDAYRSEIEALVLTIVENTPKSFLDVPYHQNIETQLLQDLVQFAYEAEPVIDHAQATDTLRPFMEAGQKFPRVRSLSFLAHLCRLPGSAFLEFVSKVRTDPDVPDKWATRFQQHHDRTKGEFTGTLLGLQRRLAAFMSASVSRVTQRSDFRLETVGERPTTLIIGTPMGSEATQTFSAIMITQLIQHLLRLAKAQPTRRLPVPVMIYLDEVINQARIPGLEDYIATLREFWIGFVIGLQDHSGLQQRYGDNAARKLLSNLRTKIVVGQGINPDQARDSVLPMLGDTTIVTHGASSGDHGGSESEHVIRRPLMTIDQIRAMPFGEVILGLHEGQITRTRLALMPRRDPETGRWRYDPIPSANTKTMCAPLVRMLDALPVDRRFTEMFRRERRNQGKPALDREVLLYRLGKAGDLFVPKPAQAPAGPGAANGAPGGTAAQQQPPANGQTETTDAAITDLLETAKLRAQELREAQSTSREKSTGESAGGSAKAREVSLADREHAPVAKSATAFGQSTADHANRGLSEQERAKILTHCWPNWGYEELTGDHEAILHATRGLTKEEIQAIARMANTMPEGSDVVRGSLMHYNLAFGKADAQGAIDVHGAAEATGFFARPITLDNAASVMKHVEGVHAAAPAPALGQPVSDTAHIMDEVRGLYNALLVRRDLVVNTVSGPTVWRVQGDEQFALAIRHEVIEAYAARRSTKVERLVSTWEAAGLAKAVPVPIQRSRETVRVYLLTHEAVRDDRVAPNLRDKMAAWPEMCVRTTPTQTKTGAAGAHTWPAPDDVKKPSAPRTTGRPQAEKSSDPEVVLRAVVRWAEAHREEIVSPGSDPIGQWDTTVGDTQVMLVRSNVAMRLLWTYAADPRAIQRAWKDSGIVVTSGFASEESRFTILARVDTGTSTLRYLAFAWAALERAGLHRGAGSAAP